MLWTQAQATTTARPRTSLALVHAVQIADAGRAVLVRDQHLADDAVGKTVTRPLFSAGAMWTSAELYFATTSHPAMQLPQKWHAGRALHRHGERGLADVDDVARRAIAPRAAGSRRCT